MVTLPSRTASQGGKEREREIEREREREMSQRLTSPSVETPGARK